MGAIGIAKNGVAIFNALDALERDAVAHEVQDECSGHPERSGTYHYHDIPDCLTEGESTHKASGLVGWALDGYPIFGPRGHGGKLLTNEDLDACHGQKSKVYYEGRWQKIYHYNATLEYPYTLGCFRGTPASTPGTHSRARRARAPSAHSAAGNRVRARTCGHGPDRPPRPHGAQTWQRRAEAARDAFGLVLAAGPAHLRPRLAARQPRLGLGGPADRARPASPRSSP